MPGYITQTYVRFSTYRICGNGQTIENEDPPEKKVQSRDHLQILSEMPENCYAFAFFDRKEFKTEDEVLIGQPRNKSGIFYIGKETTLGEAEQIDPKTPEQIGFIRRIRRDYYPDNTRVALTKFGTLFHLGLKDTVPSPEEIKSA